MLFKREVIAEGYRKGLKRALEALNEAILLTEKADEPNPHLKPLMPYKAKKTELGGKSDWTQLSGSVWTPKGKVLLGNVIERHFNRKKAKDRRTR